MIIIIRLYCKKVLRVSTAKLKKGVGAAELFAFLMFSYPSKNQMWQHSLDWNEADWAECKVEYPTSNLINSGRNSIGLISDGDTDAAFLPNCFPVSDTSVK